MPSSDVAIDVDEKLKTLETIKPPHLLDHDQMKGDHDLFPCIYVTTSFSTMILSHVQQDIFNRAYSLSRFDFQSSASYLIRSIWRVKKESPPRGFRSYLQRWVFPIHLNTTDAFPYDIVVVISKVKPVTFVYLQHSSSIRCFQK